MSLSDYGENKVLALLKADKTYYLGLYTVTPSDDGTGGTEVSGGGYARQAVTFGTPSGGSMSNSAAIEFPTATADWGTANGWGLFDASTGGNLVWYGAITTPRQLLTGDIYRVQIGNFTLSID